MAVSPQTILKSAERNKIQSKVDALNGITGVETRRLAAQLKISFADAQKRKDAARIQEDRLKKKFGRPFIKYIDRNKSIMRSRTGSKTFSPLITQAKTKTFAKAKAKTIARQKELRETKAMVVKAKANEVRRKKINQILASKKEPTMTNLRNQGFTKLESSLIRARWESKGGLYRQYGLSTDKFFKALEKKGRAVDYESQAQAFKVEVKSQLIQAGRKSPKLNAPITTFQKEYNKLLRSQKSLDYIDKKLNKVTSGTFGVTPATKNVSFKRFENKLSDEYKRIRNKPVSQRTNKEQALIGLAGTGATVIGTVRKVPGVIWNMFAAFFNPIDTVKGLYKLASDKATQKQVQTLAGKYGKKIQNGDPDALSTFFAELAVLLGIGKVVKVKELAKLSPNYVKYKNGKWVIRQPPKEVFTVKGKKRLLRERVQAPSIKRPLKSVNDFLKGRKPGQFRKFTKKPELILKKQTVASGASSLSKQTQLAGQEITAVNAAAQQLTSWLKTKVIVRKPIPGENSFPKSIKSILNKFDNGTKLTKKEFVKVNKYLQKNVAPNITLLERSLYADPKSGFRVSRLGITKARDATFRDVLRGNFRLWDRQKPQVLIFENAKIAKFPKSLKGIEKKLKAGKKLTQNETYKLISWQVTTGSGKFKPIGSTIYKGGVELEVTLAPGELIKRIKQVGFTFIEGKKVNFVTAEVWKPTKTILEKIKKAQAGKLTNKQLLDLEKLLSKKLGRKIKVQTPKSKGYTGRTVSPTTPVLRIKGRGIAVVRAITTGRKMPTVKRVTSRKTVTRKPAVRKVTARKPSVRKTPTRKPSVRKTPTRKPSVRKPIVRKPAVRKPTARKPSVRKTPTKRIITKRLRTGKPTARTIPLPVKIPTFNSKLPRGQRLAFDILYRTKGKNRSLKVRLPLNKAIKRATSLIDNTTARSMTLKIVGTTKASDLRARPTLNKFRLRKTTKVLRLVEKSKYTIDTRGEKKGLTIAKKLKKTTKRKVKKKP